jgi:hypothetical protein
MLKSKYEKSTELINLFILAEHKELGTTKLTYNKINLFRYILYEFLNKLNIKPNDQKKKRMYNH